MLVVAVVVLALTSRTSVLACSGAAPCDVGKTWGGTPKGVLEKDWAGTGLDAYIARPPATVAAADYAVLQIPDIYGLQLKNARLYADELANATGATVVLPDYFYKPGAGAFAQGTNTDKAKFDAWMAEYPRDQVVADSLKIINASKKMFNVSKVDAIGFCWGGRFAALLAGGAPPTVNAAVLLHPSQLTLPDVEALTAPTLFLVNGQDPAVSDAFRAQIVDVLKTKPASALHYYPNARHGHTLRADPTPDSADAFNRTVAWLKRH